MLFNKKDAVLTAMKLAKQAGKIILTNFKASSQKAMPKVWKPDNTVVTETDRIINKLVIKTLKSNFPDHGIIAEEGSMYNNEKYTWVCDPVDGTTFFAHGLPNSVFGLALLEDGMPIIGVLYDPFTDRLLGAAKGKGAFLNAKPVRVSNLKTIKGGVFGVLPFSPRSGLDLTELYKSLVLKGAKILNVPILNMALLIGCGKMSGVVFPMQDPWDAAPAKIIIEEAGGKVTDLFGQNQRYDKETTGFVVTKGKIHGQLLDVVQKVLKQ